MTELEKARILASNACINIFESTNTTEPASEEVLLAWKIGKKITKLLEQERLDNESRNRP